LAHKLNEHFLSNTSSLSVTNSRFTDGWDTFTIISIEFYYTIEPVKDSFRPRNLDMVDGEIRIKFIEVRDISRSKTDLIHLTFIKCFINSPAKYR
jgi:hypothetical protein